jgi:phage tail sheath protein FI
MTEPVFGLTITRDDAEPRPVVASDMSVVGLVGTAPEALADHFPLDTPVLISSSDLSALTKLGDTGTLPEAVKLINHQLADFQVAAKVVVVRVAAGVDAAATIVNLVGDQDDGTGVYALLKAGPALGVIPRLIGVPGYTHQVADGALANAVCAALPGVCTKLLAHAIVEGPGTNATAIKDWRETLASERLIPVDSWVKIQSGANVVTAPGVGTILGIAVRRDFEKRGVPGHSWANQPLQGVVGPARYVPFSLTDGATEGQDLLNANIGVLLRGELGVETAIASSGFVFVGTDNAGDDPIWQFYNITRMRDYIHLGLLRTLRFYLGKFNLTGHTIQAVLNTMNLWLRDLRADDHILGYRVGFEPDKNSPENLRLGRFRCYFAAEEPAVLRRIDIDSRRYRPALDRLMNDLVAQTSDLVG